MITIVFDLSDIQQAALEKVSGGDAVNYLSKRVTEILDSYVDQVGLDDAKAVTDKISALKPDKLTLLKQYIDELSIDKSAGTAEELSARLPDSLKADGG